MRVRAPANLPLGVRLPAPPRVHVKAGQRVEQLGKAIDLIGLVLLDVAPAEIRSELRDRLCTLSREAGAAKEPAVMGALDRVARELDDRPPPWVQGQLFG